MLITYILILFYFSILTDGDVSSVGTVSKAEEISRLNDVEDSFEERYMKVRSIAFFFVRVNAVIIFSLN